MKKCPFCAEEIQDAAIVCKHCKRELTGAPARVAATTTEKPALQPAVGLTKGLALLVLGIGFLMTFSTTTAGFGIFAMWFGIAFALTGSSMTRWGGGFFLALILGAIGISMRSSPATSEPATSSPASTAPAPAAASTPRSPQRPTHQVALIASKGYESESGNYWYVEGQVKNVSGESLKNVTAVTTWFDKDNGFIKSSDAIIDYNPILPGQTSPFKTITSGNPAMSNYTVNFKTLMGGTLSVDDLRKK